ncbi:MAG TPA: hypothetical protein VKD23_08485 [Terriglobales bacterium]|nr:hypothetical protein [Terriglobales bacterium]
MPNYPYAFHLNGNFTGFAGNFTPLSRIDILDDINPNTRLAIIRPANTNTIDAYYAVQ